MFLQTWLLGILCGHLMKKLFASFQRCKIQYHLAGKRGLLKRMRQSPGGVSYSSVGIGGTSTVLGWCSGDSTVFLFYKTFKKGRSWKRQESFNTHSSLENTPKIQALRAQKRGAFSSHEEGWRLCRCGWVREVREGNEGDGFSFKVFLLVFWIIITTKNQQPSFPQGDSGPRRPCRAPRARLWPGAAPGAELGRRQRQRLSNGGRKRSSGSQWRGGVTVVAVAKRMLFWGKR